MELPLLVIRSECDGVVSLNQTILGETGGQPISAPVPKSASIYLRFDSLYTENGKIPVSLLRKLNLLDGKIVPPYPDACVRITAWPKGVYHIEIIPPSLRAAQEGVPHTICQCEFNCAGGLFLATVFQENGTHIAIEEKMSGRLHFVHTFHKKLDAIRLEPHVMNGVRVLAAHAKCGERSYLVAIEYTKQRFHVILDKEADQFEFSNGKLTAVTNDQRTGIGLVEVWARETEEIRYSVSSRLNAAPKRAEDCALAFTQAVRHGLAQEAVSRLSFSLRGGLDYAEIADYLGNFYDYQPPPWDYELSASGAQIALTYKKKGLDIVKVFCFEMAEEADDYGRFKVNNIKELC